jgi:hypothetical protein
LARPGGGGHYSGGGGSHGGGGGGFGGGGFGGGTYGGGYHSTTSVGPSWIGLLVLIVVGILVFQAIARSRRRSFGSDIREQVPPFEGIPPTDPRALLEPLLARDPALTEQSVAEHVRQMADILRAAWCGGDMRPARPFVSDGVYSRFQVQLALMRQENRRNVMSDARVLSATLEAVEDAAPLDVVHVRMTAEGRDTEVPADADDEAIRRALARTRVEPYTEIWSLVRRRGALTKPADFPVGRACPGCGAPLDGGETIKCRYCGALVCSGEHDWVLSEITQVVEWSPRGARPTGLDDLRLRDPGVACEVLEDRASYVFWKWIEAGRARAVLPLRKCASPRLLMNDGSDAYLDSTRGAFDVAVGGANLMRCEPGGADGFDRAYIEILWSARFGPRPATPSQIVMRLARRSGAISPPSMTALVCHACGAPLSNSDSAKCDHCGAELTAGDGAWVLDGVLGGGAVS